jgi:hypothetical protein
MVLATWLTHRGREPEPPPEPESTPLDKDSGLLIRVPAKECATQCADRPGAGRRYRWYGTRPEPMPSFTGPIEGPYPERLGICCSGGGIRSAAYNLGALQSLQETDELVRATYLAAVSGGSYIAAAFSMVAKAWEPADDGGRPILGKAGHDDSDPDALARLKPFAPGSPEEQYLRNRSSYMAPSGSDKLYLGLRAVLGMVFNLVFLGLPLAALGLLLSGFLFKPWGDCNPNYCTPEIQPMFWITPAVPLAFGLTFGLYGMIRRSPTERQRQFLQAWSIRLIMVAAVLGLLLVAVPALVSAFRGQAFNKQSATPRTPATVGGAAGLAGLIAGLLAYLRQAFSSPSAAAKTAGKARKALAGLNARTRQALIYTAGALLGPLLLFAFVVLGAAVGLASSDNRGFPSGVVVAGVLALAVFGFLYSVSDVNSWSLHPFYKRRLSSAFALKRVHWRKLDESELDRVQLVPPVTEQADDVGAALERDYDTLVPLSKTALHEGDWPTLLVCAAANVSDPGAVPPGRSVTSFTFSAYSVGGPLIGGAATPAYERSVVDKASWVATLWAWIRSDPRLKQPRRARDLSLPAAVAMSGAALAPSMGKSTKRPLTFLLALANVRLGVWLPNPRWVMLTKKSQRKFLKRPRPSYLLHELMGRNRVNDNYIYVTDGGHYENLGLVELLRRGCTQVYCFDASGGQAFDELGDAIALARSELGVEVEIDPRAISPDEETGIAEKDVVTGTFAYRDGTRGTLVYARNVLTDPPGAPWDAQAYHRVDPKFPHNPTADQLYTDQKFEGYRVLGERAAKRAIVAMRLALARS